MKRSLTALVLVGSLAASAGAKPRKAAKGVVVSEHNGTVTIEIGSDDYFLPVWAKYNELLNAAGAPPRSLDIALRPGIYRSGAPQLDDDMRKGSNLSVRLRSADPAHPAVITNSQIILAADEVTLEDLVLRGSSSAAPILDVTVKHKLTIRRCVLVDNARHGWGGGTLVRVVAGYQSGAKTALIEDSWFIRNSEAKPTSLLLFNTLSQPDYFQSVVFERSVFLDNRISDAVIPSETEELRFHDCVLAEGPKSGLLVSLTAPRTRLSFEDGVLVLDGWEHLAKAAGGPAVAIRGSRVYAPGAPPAGVTVDGPVHDLHEAAHLRKRLEQLAAEARPPTGPALRKALGL